jgi:rubrerythrin
MWKENTKMWFQESNPLGKIEKLATATTGEYFEGIQMCKRMAKEDDKKVYASKDNAFLGWKCRNCGHIPSGSNAPERCPVCSHPQAYFKRISENY